MGMRRRQLGTAAQPRARRQTGQLFTPVLGIGTGTVGPVVCLLVRDEFGDRERGTCGGTQLAESVCFRIEFGGATQDRRRADTVEDDVVAAQIQQMPIGAHSVQRGRGQPIAEQIQWRIVVGGHPRSGRRHRIGGAGQVCHRKRCECTGIRELPRAARTDSEPHQRRVQFGRRCCGGRAQRADLQRPHQIQIHRHGVGELRIQLLSYPPAQLRLRQRMVGWIDEIGPGLDSSDSSHRTS